MPSRFSSEGTRGDARRVAESLGTGFHEIPIEPIVQAFGAALAPAFAGTDPGIAEENVQARVRGTILMALSNKFGWLVVATGNKSEYSVGYSTLYGDMAGGFALLKDVYKTDVFLLARHLNERAGRELIPQSVIDRAPSAELRRTSWTRTRCLPTRSSTGCSKPTSSSTSPGRSSERTASIRTWSIGPSRSSTGPSTSGVRRPPGSSCARRHSDVTGGCQSRIAGGAS